MLTDSQLQIRRNGLGASDIPVIYNMSPWQKPWQIYESRVKQELKHITNPNMEVGNLLESYVAHFAAKKRKEKIISAKEFAEQNPFPGNAEHIIDGTFRSVMYPHILVTPDFVSEDDDCIYEIKVIGPYSAKNSFSIEGEKVNYPRYYEMQCQIQMHVLQREFCILAVGCLPKNAVDCLPVLQALGEKDIKKWVENELDIRRFYIPYCSIGAQKVCEFAEEWWEKYIVTETPDPHWPIKKNDRPTLGTVEG